MGTGVYAFRMLVCQFRREMAFDDIFAFWERLWAAEQLAGTQLKVAFQPCRHECACYLDMCNCFHFCMTACKQCRMQTQVLP